MTDSPLPPSTPPGGSGASRPSGRKAVTTAHAIRSDSGVAGPGTLQEDGSRWIWPFRLTEKLGVGGMGVVYRGQYVPKKLEVAVKMLPEDVTDPVVLQRFERELDVLKSLRHPNIVRCFGGSCEDDARFYAMELVSGGTLEDLLQQRGRLSWEQTIEYGQQMAAGLSAAHAMGVVHRDLKPANFLITSDGKLKLADFGLAFIEAKRRITRAGKTAGTVLYMSPEQIRGREVGAASDLYSLGCVLYEMLSGQPPFDGDAQATILHAHVMTPPPRLASLVMDCPPALEKLVHQLLAKEPADRPRSAEEVQVALKSMTPDLVIAEPKRNPLSGRRSNQPLTLPGGAGGSGDSFAASPFAGVTKSASLPRLPRSDSRLPSWTLPLAIGTAVVMAGLAWQQMSRAAALQPYRDAWLQTASRTGPQQTAALELVGRLGHGDAASLAVIRAALDSPDAKVRQAAAEAAVNLKSGDMDLNGRLRQLAKDDPNDGVRSAAAQAVAN